MIGWNHTAMPDETFLLIINSEICCVQNLIGWQLLPAGTLHYTNYASPLIPVTILDPNHLKPCGQHKTNTVQKI